MNKINITFLGTSGAIPTKKRNHTAILARFASENILIDCGEGTQRQFKMQGISPTKLTRILITHWHGDHILGLPGLFQTLALSGYQKTLEIYGPRGTKNLIQLVEELQFAFRIKLKVHEIYQGTIIDKEDFKVEAAEMSHGVPAIAYSITLKDKIRLNKSKLKKFKLPNSPILGELASGKDIIFKGKKIKASQVTYYERGKKVTIVLDTIFNENAISLAKNSDLLIAESTFSKDDKDKIIEAKHLMAHQAAEIAKKSKSKKLILTHISQRYEKDKKRILDEARKIFKNSFLVEDLEVLEI